MPALQPPSPLKQNELFEYKMGNNWIKCQVIDYIEKDLGNKKFGGYLVRILDEKFKSSYPYGTTIIGLDHMPGRIRQEPNDIIKNLIDLCEIT